MPDPIIDPATIAVALKRPSPCTRCADVEDSLRMDTCNCFYRKFKTNAISFCLICLAVPEICTRKIVDRVLFMPSNSVVSHHKSRLTSTACPDSIRSLQLDI